jgi:hypothetical protein
MRATTSLGVGVSSAAGFCSHHSFQNGILVRNLEVSLKYFTYPVSSEHVILCPFEVFEY